MLMSLEILFVANLVSHDGLQNSANLGKMLNQKTEGIHSSKKFVNTNGALVGNRNIAS